MNTVMQWGKLTALIEPVYPQAEGAGWPPVGLERVLRNHFLQHWFNLSVAISTICPGTSGSQSPRRSQRVPMPSSRCCIDSRHPQVVRSMGCANRALSLSLASSSKRCASGSSCFEVKRRSLVNGSW